MAGIIDLFNSKIQADKVVGENNFFNNEKQLTEFNKLQQKYISNVDYSQPDNFARFGSAEEYYKNAITYINSEFPYDSPTEKKLEWINSLSEFEFYLYKNAFPKAVGYVNLSGSQYININSHVQTPNESAKDTYDNLSKYTLNTVLDFNSGITIEAWLNFSGSSQETSILSTNVLYGYTGSVGEQELFRFYRTSGSNPQLILSSSDNSYAFDDVIADSQWHHYSLNLKSGSLSLFVDGNIKQIISDPSLSFLTSSYVFVERGLMTKDLFDSYTTASFNKTHVFKVGGGDKLSVDDLRIWNGSRSVEQIGRYWFTSVDGNNFTNIDSTNLLVYYKFNEGWDDQYKFLCLDYSGRQNDGEIINFVTSCRSSESAFDLSGIVQDVEKKDLIYKGLSYSTIVQEFYENSVTSGKEYDLKNVHMLYNKFPSWLLEQEELSEVKHLKQIIQIISAYFDDLFNKIGEITEYKAIKLDGEMDNIYPFYDKILTSTGFDITELFSNLDIIEKVSSRNDTTLFDEDIQKVKNAIFKNIYNNISYIFKAKGTEKSLKSLIRAYGLNEDLVRINLYSNGATYKAHDRSKEKIVKKKTVNLVGDSSIYLSSSNIIEDESMDYFTLETAVSFPANQKPITNSTSSIFGIQNNLTQSDLSWSSANTLYYVTVENDINYGSRFVMSSGSTQLVSSSYIKNLYDGTVWNIALRKKPDLDTTIGASVPYNYNIELYAVNNNSYVPQEVLLSSSYSYTEGYFKYYIGARKQDITGSAQIQSNSKFLYCNLWKDYLNNENIISHNRDILNYGTDE